MITITHCCYKSLSLRYWYFFFSRHVLVFFEKSEVKVLRNLIFTSTILISMLKYTGNTKIRKWSSRMLCSLSFLVATRKTPYMFVLIQKQYLKIFAFLVAWISELFAREICNFFRTRLIFNIFYCFWIVHIVHLRISQKVKCVLM